jgi:uncharacterized UPF0160 family protein
MTKTRIVTHDSSFHTDDVFAVAVMLLVYPDAEVVRSRDAEITNTADVVLDTGLELDPSKQRFDHHQREGAGKRDNGIPYASFGLVWKEYGERLAGGAKEANIIDKKLVQAIDAIDNGVAIADYKFSGVRDYSIGEFFNSYLNDLDSTDGPDRLYRIFMQCVDIARDLLTREISKAKFTVQGMEAVRKAYEHSVDKRLIELPTETLPWRETLNEYPEPLYVIYERPDKKWALKAVPDLTKAYGHQRKNLPQAWVGKEGKELQEATGVSDAVFVHRAGFMATASTKDGVLTLARIALS